MSNDPKSKSESKIDSKSESKNVLDAITQTSLDDRPQTVMDDRTLTKSALATAMFSQALQSYGLVGMFKKKKSLAQSLIQDLRDGFAMIDEVYDKANQ